MQDSFQAHPKLAGYILLVSTQRKTAGFQVLPNGCGLSRNGFGFNALSVIRTPGKKATRLCPCGYLGDPASQCRCTQEQVQRYRSRISGPLLDRLDMHIEVPRVAAEFLRKPSASSESTAEVAVRVVRARELQQDRQGMCNSRLDSAAIERYCRPDKQALALLEQAARRFNISARAYHRILKVARTIADLGAGVSVSSVHVSEAMTLRQLDRQPLATVTHARG